LKNKNKSIVLEEVLQIPVEQIKRRKERRMGRREKSDGKRRRVEKEQTICTFLMGNMILGYFHMWQLLP
jgi:hypothetical protein